MAKKKKIKKVKYKKVAFKLSAKEMQQLDICAKIQKTTANKIIKKALRYYIKNNFDKEAFAKVEISENQMDIFDIIGESEDNTIL